MGSKTKSIWRETTTIITQKQNHLQSKEIQSKEHLNCFSQKPTKSKAKTIKSNTTETRSNQKTTRSN